VGTDEGDGWLYLLLLSQMLDKAVYSELRTKQQLGYIVQCGVTEANGVRALVFIIQSSVKPPPEVEDRLEAFLRLFRGTLSLLSEDELGTYRDALAAELGDVDQRADGQASRLWGECAMRRYDFGRPWRNAQRMRRVTREGLLAFFDDHIAASAPMRRRLSTHVFAKRAAPKTLRVDPLPDEYWPLLEDGLAKNWAADRAAVV
jgi:insulysin